MKILATKILKVFLLVDIVAIIGIVGFFQTQYLYAFEIGFISSSLVMFASLIAYRRMVNTRVEHNIITIDDSKDVIDLLEDPYDLYSEDKKNEDIEEDLVSVVKEERQKLKANHRSLFEILKDTKAALSFYRLGAYMLLILGFLYLNRQGLLHIPSYIIALGLPPLLMVLILLQHQKIENTGDSHA